MKTQRAVTLVEMLVVLAILAGLLGLLLPAVHAARERARVGGWTIEILPFLEETSLEQSIPSGIGIADAPDSLLRPPTIFRCPVRDALDAAPTARYPAHYVFFTTGRRRSFSLFDAPLSLSEPRASGPEMGRASIQREVGPHNGGFFYARGFQQGIDYLPHQANGL